MMPFVSLYRQLMVLITNNGIAGKNTALKTTRVAFGVYVAISVIFDLP